MLFYIMFPSVFFAETFEITNMTSDFLKVTLRQFFSLLSYLEK